MQRAVLREAFAWSRASCASSTWAPSTSPVEDIVGHITTVCLSTVSLARVAAVLSDPLAALTLPKRGPVFVQVERILRLDRMRRKRRSESPCWSPCWQRLRDDMRWQVSSAAGLPRPGAFLRRCKRHACVQHCRAFWQIHPFYKRSEGATRCA